VQVKEFTLKEFEDLSSCRSCEAKIMDADPNLDQTIQICQDVDKALCIYQHIYEDLKKNSSVYAVKYFERQ
jgi:hypothetical protein